MGSDNKGMQWRRRCAAQAWREQPQLTVLSLNSKFPPSQGAGKQAVSHPDKLDKEMGEKHDPFKS